MGELEPMRLISGVTVAKWKLPSIPGEDLDQVWQALTDSKKAEIRRVQCLLTCPSLKGSPRILDNH